jgi:hypothetical protein
MTTIDIFFHFVVISNDFKDQYCPLKQCTCPFLLWWMPLFPHGLNSKCLDLIWKYRKKKWNERTNVCLHIRLFMLVVEVYFKWIPSASFNSNFDALFCIICWRTLVEGQRGCEQHWCYNITTNVQKPRKKCGDVKALL